MQTNCPQCSNRLVLDDAKVPATPFMLKCPKCQATVKLPGKGAQPAPGAPVPTPPTQPAPPQAPAGAAAPAAPAPQAPPAPTPSLPPVPAGAAGRALVALPSQELASAADTLLTRLGFSVEHLDAGDEKFLRLQQGDYTLVATTRNGQPPERNVYTRLQTIPLEIRRRTFLMIVGDEFQSGEGTQAFAVLADLVVKGGDIPQTDRLLAQTLGERRRLYQTFWDAEDKRAEGKL